MFDENSFIEEYSSIAFSKPMLNQTMDWYYRAKNKEQSDYDFNTYKRINKSTSDIEDRVLKFVKSVNWQCFNLFHPLFKDDCNEIVYGFEYSPNNMKMNLSYWQDRYNMYKTYVAKHGTNPDTIFAIPSAYFNYFYKIHGDKVEHFKPYVYEKNLKLGYHEKR